MIPENKIDPTDRYSRQTLFSPIGLSGQQKLKNAHAAVIGVGATGAAAASLLARAGVGTLTLIDRDFVEPSNLQRQVLFTEADALESLPKAEAARRRIADFNSEVTVHAHIADLTPTNIHALLGDADILLDATDNFETRYLLNDYAVQQQKPWIYTAAIGSYAATMNILPADLGETKRTACLACIFPAPPSGVVETCDTAGILNTAVNLAASLAVTEALKLLTGNAPALRRTLFSLDLWTGDHSEIRTGTPRADCEICAHHRFPHLQGAGRPQITLCGRNSVQIHEHKRPVDLQELAARLSPHGAVRFNQMLLRFERTPHTLTVFADGRALIQGTTDVAVARSLYARFIGS
ncbi:ThiF family adenylyltransferase [Terriglobus saanensis]|uniref:UBA/THIF-type NAD/FAD binding protein n=1 Tax=Terriglobus saanensis (strain ATCC BAA-1853 / DSM 23119 / SP1PR4) TaxID=401053 RepID=E8V7P5_TERSS|nr:ThiF family adenylyltransferase [Terriglobus saanensis]ADV81743.1 UBA/THIF-type NAD/FAD binding protein [Terriglobus saanensis SP1PR4]